MPNRSHRFHKGAAFGAQKATDAAIQTPDIFTPRAGLSRTWHKLAAEKQLNIGYFGGSITEGAGASDAAKTSWRALTTAWFQGEFPDTEIREISAALGGTGSMLGAFRLPHDLLQYQPDLIFVEFAVNDDFGDNARQALERRRALEGIVRRIWRELPQCEIVFVYTITQSTANARQSDGLPRSTRLHEEIARHYEIPALNVGQALLEQIEAGAGDWNTFTIDSVHPTDAGYQIYADVIVGALQQLREGARELPAPLDVAAWQNMGMVNAAELSAPGWTIVTEAPATMTAEWHPERYATKFLAASAPQSELKFAFSGSIIGLFYLIAPDSGDIEYAIDDGEPVRLSMWDKYAQQFTRPNYRILADDLAAGAHQLKLRILPERDENSTGTTVRLLAMLVGDSV